MNAMTPRQTAINTVVILGVLFVAWTVIQIRGILLLLVLGILFGAAIEPLVHRLRTERLSRAQAILVVYLNLILILFVVSVLLVPSLVTQGRALFDEVPNIMANARSEAAGIESDSVREAIVRGTREVDRTYRELRGGEGVDVEGETAVRYAVSIGGVLFTIITVLIVAFYWLTEKTLIKRAFIHAIPHAGRDRVYHAWDEVEKRIGGWARGQLTLMVIIGVISTVAYGLIGLDFWLALGLVAGITEAIPFIGPFIGGGAAVAVALTDSFDKVIIVIIFVIILQQVEGALLVPRVMRNAVGMTPLTVVLAVLIGSRLGGPLGAILAIPVGAAVQAIVQEALRRDIDAGDVTVDALRSSRSIPQIPHLGRLRRRPRTQAP